MSWFSRCSWCGGPFNGGNYRHCTIVSFGDEPAYDSNQNSYNQNSDFPNPPPHHNYEIDSRSNTGATFQGEFAKFEHNFEQFIAQLSCSNCGGLFNGGNCPICSIVGAESKFVHDPNPFSYDNTPDFYDQPPQLYVETYSYEFIKSRVEDFVPILSESEDTFGSDSERDLPSCDDFSPIDVPEEKSVTFSDPLFDSNDDFTSSNDESLSVEDVREDKVKIYSNPLFEFDDEYISSDVNPLFDEVLENIKNKDSYDSNLDEPDLLVTPPSDASEDKCFDLGDNVDEIELLLHRDPSTPKMSVASIPDGFTNEPPLEKNDDLFDFESKENEWKKILYDALIDDLMIEDKVFDPIILENFFFSNIYKEVPISEGSSVTTTKTYMETYKNDIYSTVDACSNACEMWTVIERLKQGESINVQDLETNLYWEFGKFTSQDSESLESYYSRFYKMMNELIRNQCDVTNHQVNVQFLLQLQLEWKRFVTLVKQSQELKTVSYHKLYDILKQHQIEVNEIKAKRIARTANPLALVAQQQPVYHPQNHPTYYTQNSSTRSQQAATKNRGKAIINSIQPIYDQEPSMVAEDDETSKDKKIDKLMALISLSSTGYENQRIGNVAGARETVGSTVEEAEIQLNEEQADWRDDTDDELEDQELEAQYMYMAQLQEVSPDAADSGPIFDSEPVQK
nr:hypothetical protein [Tanacetum cinerariifolium]